MTLRLQRLARLMAASVFALLIAASFAWSGDMPLKGTLKLRLGQTGFAGVSGTEYRIEPNGAWRAVNFVNEKMLQTAGEGHLPSGTMIEISHLVAKADLANLSAEPFKYAGVNPVVIEANYGEHKVQASFPPGFTLEESCPGQTEGSACAFFELCRLIQSNLTSK